MPVLPEVGSRRVAPGTNTPSLSACSTMRRAIRSFTDPPGFWPSSLTTMRTDGLGLSALTSTMGVLPMRSRMLPTTATWPLPSVLNRRRRGRWVTGQPPATAGRMDKVSPSETLVSSLSRYRTSSSLR